ncbi:MAG TPA: STAS domain-containing protein [bacterium]|jgi:anti-sigma B factor antagonist/stage II sporulation protein AA (anti-sigma F factor antagonist)
MDAPIGSWWHVEHETIGEAVVLHVHGEIDLATAPKLAQHLASLPGDAPVVVDFTHVEYLDLTGVRALEDFHAQSIAADRPVIVVGPLPQVRRILDLVGLGRRLRIVDTVAMALEALHIPPPNDSD